jgi:hypothetical protein
MGVISIGQVCFRSKRFGILGTECTIWLHDPDSAIPGVVIYSTSTFSVSGN